MQGCEPMHIVGAFLDETSWTAFQHSTIIFFMLASLGWTCLFCISKFKLLFQYNYYQNLIIFIGVLRTLYIFSFYMLGFTKMNYIFYLRASPSQV